MNIDCFLTVTSFIFQRDEVGVMRARLGIDFQAIRPALLGKRSGVNEGTRTTIYPSLS
jgi:hypothetical protein